MPISPSNPIPQLLEFIEYWKPELNANHRIDPNEIPEFIPPPLRALYQLAGNYPVHHSQLWRRPNWTPGLFGPQDQLLPIDQLQVTNGRFRFLHENQGVWNCETLSNEDDPPVFSDSRAYEDGDDQFREVCPSLSHFLTTYCLQELIFGSSCLFCVDSEVAHPRDLVSEPLVEHWIDGRYVYSQPTHSFYLCQGELLIMQYVGTGDIWIGCQSERCVSSLKPTIKVRRI